MDPVAAEEPLEIRIAGEPVAITMRTPGDDERLAVGFLFAERVIDSIDDVGSVVHCGRPGDDGYGNTIDVTPGPGSLLNPDKIALSRRGTLTTSACGVCGRKSIDDLLTDIGPLPLLEPVPLALLDTSTARLGEAQPAFARTGGMHAAMALSRDGVVLAAAEDVGRHNATDKVVGRLLMDRLIGRSAQPSRAPVVLVVSGRISFEIVQKAAVAGIPIVAAVSAPTSLAIDLATRLGMTLGGFVRGGRLNLYGATNRVAV